MSLPAERVIDLDAGLPQVAESPRRRWRQRWRAAARIRVALLVVVGLLAAGGLGSVGGVRWQQARQQRKDASVASVSVLFTSLGSADVNFSDQREVVADGNITVVNTGPRSLRVRSLRIDEPDFALFSRDSEQWLPAGDWTTFTVEAQVGCANAAWDRQLRMLVEVQTVDGRIRELAHPLTTGSLWGGIITVSCWGVD